MTTSIYFDDNICKQVINPPPRQSTDTDMDQL